jgi:hypothetical protein
VSAIFLLFHSRSNGTHNDNKADDADDDNDGVDDGAEEYSEETCINWRCYSISQIFYSHLNMRAGTFLFPITLLSSAVHILFPAYGLAPSISGAVS